MSDAITLEDFRASVLAPWTGDDSAACQAAAEAMWAVACRFAQARKGSIVIDVPDQTSVRMVTNYIEAMLADQEQLSRLTATWHDGEVTIAGKKVLCLPRGTSRRPRGVLARIEMKGGDVATATVLPSDFQLAKTFIHSLITCAHTGDSSMDYLAQKFGYPTAKAFAIAWDQRAAEKRFAMRRVEAVAADYDPKHPARDYHFTKPTSVPSVPRPLPTRGEQIVSPEFEQARAFNIGKNEMSPQRLPVLTGPRWRR